MNQPYIRRILIAVVLGCCVPFAGNADKKDRGSKNKEPYTMSLLALQGPGAIDVVITIQTNDPGGFPVPNELEKLKVKFLDGRSRSKVVSNAFDVPLVNGVATFTSTRAPGALLVEVQALLKTPDDEEDDHGVRKGGRDDDKKGKGRAKEKKYYHSDSDFGDCEEHEIVLKGKVNILLRPDLVVDRINAPQQVGVNTPFSIEAVIREANLQLGATATVSLYEGSVQRGSMTGVHVAAGGQVSTVFQGLKASPAGIHNYTIRISDADPAEYNTSNNEGSVSILVVVPAVPMQYSMLYRRVDNYNYRFLQTSICDGDYEQTQTGKNENFQFSGFAVPSLSLHAPFDKVAWTLENESGVVSTYDTTNLVPYNSFNEIDGTYGDNYVVFDTTGGFYFYLDIGMYFVDSVPYRSVSFQLYKYATNFVYVYHYPDGSVTADSVSDPDSFFIHASSLVALKLALEDDGYTMGGKAVANIPPSRHIMFNNTQSYDDTCNTTIVETYQYDLFSADSSGTTNPSQLPSQQRSSGLPALTAVTQPNSLPSETRLDRNYPNPFNPSTNVRFELPEDHRVNITVYNTLGQQVQTLVNDELRAGYHTVVWNAGMVPSGVYFIRMNAGAYTSTQRAILVK